VGLDPQTGEVMEQKRVSNEAEEMGAVLGSLGGPLHGAMEVGTNSWAMYRVMRPYFEELVVVDPAGVWDRRRERGAKTDRRDALRLAQLLARGELKGVWIPDERTQDLRVLARGKVRASWWVTRACNEIGSLLRSWGYRVEQSLLSRGGRKLVEEAQLPGRSQRVLELWVELLETAERIEAELEAAVKEEAEADPVCQVLRSVPQVGPLTALVVRAEVGDVRRFPSAKALVSYAGLCPRVSQSGEQCRYGRLGKWGDRWLRYVLVLAANRIARGAKDSRLHRLWWRMCLRHNRNDAKIAVARKLVQLMWRMLKDGRRWEELESLEQARA
jgi:transposase